MRTKLLIFLLLLTAFLVGRASGGSLRISEFVVNAEASIASLAATNTEAGVRYGLQTSSNLVVWNDPQFRLARSNRQSFQTFIPPSTSRMFFRIIKDPFRTELLAGSWRVYSLVAADSAGDWAGWYTGQFSSDRNGFPTASSWQRSDGDNSLPPPTTFSVAPDGSISSDIPLTSHWQMSLDRNAISFVMNDGGGGVSLGMLMRTGGSGFKTADLEGQWRLFCLVAADSAGDWAGWYTGQLSFNTNGLATWFSVQRSNGDSTLPPPTTFSVAPDGSISGGPPLTSHWQMSLDRNAISFVMNDGGGGVSLGMLMRTGGSGFKTADLEGQWRLFCLVAADSAGDWAGWYTGQLSFNTNGLATWFSVQRSNGDSTLPAPTTFSVAPDGSISGGPPLTSHWQMSLDRNAISFVMNDGGGGVSLGMLMRN